MLYSWLASSIWQHSIPLKLDPNPIRGRQSWKSGIHTAIMGDGHGDARHM